MKSTIKVTATTAVALTQKQADRITTKIQESNKGSNIELKQVINPALIAGIKITIGSEEFDASVYTKLEKIHTQLKKSL